MNNDDVDRTLAAGHAAAERVADAVERKPDWPQVRRFVLVAVVSISLLMAGVSITVSLLASLAVACATPTQITIDLTTNALCPAEPGTDDRLESTLIVGAPSSTIRMSVAGWR